MSTHFDFRQSLPDLAPIAYVIALGEWAVLLRTSALWQVLLPTDPTFTDAWIKDLAVMEVRLQALCPKDSPYEIARTNACKKNMLKGESSWPETLHISTIRWAA